MKNCSTHKNPKVILSKTRFPVRSRLASLGLGCGFAFLVTSELLAQSPAFSIGNRAVAMSVSIDGSNFLVGIENHSTSPNTIGAQLFAANGTKLGALISTGRSGLATAVAFDGTNYLLIWEDDEMGTLTDSTGWKVYGQFISKAGAAVGSPLALTTAGVWFDGIKTLAFGNGTYLVTYTRLIAPAYGSASTNRYIAGRLVSPDGKLGSEFRISSGYGKASDVAFDGNNFFVVWCEDQQDQEIRGRFISPAGVPGVEISVDASSAPSDNPKSISFDGVNYLVAWNDEVEGADTGTWDAFGRLVSSNGELVGGKIEIVSQPGPQLLTSISFDGDNYLAVWSDMENGTNWDMYGQFIKRSGELAGDRVTISTNAGNQLGGAGFVNGKTLVLVNHGVVLGEGGIIDVESASGLFLSSRPTLQIQTTDASFGVRTNQFGFTATGPEGALIVVEACSDPAAGNWSPVRTNAVQNGSFFFSDPGSSNYLCRFYRLRWP